MSSGSSELGIAKWLIDADDSALMAKLDAAEAKVRAWSEKVGRITGGTIGGDGAGTFGGGPVTLGTPNARSSRNTQWEERMDREGYAWINGTRRDANMDPTRRDPSFYPPDATGDAAGGAGGGASWAARTNWRRVAMIGLLGVSEIQRANTALAMGDLNASLATNPVDRLAAQFQGVKGASSGIFGGPAGFILDQFGVGPSTVEQQITSASALYKSQDANSAAQLHLANVQRITGIDAGGAGQFLRREALLRGNFAETEVGLRNQMRDAQGVINDKSVDITHNWATTLGVGEILGLKDETGSGVISTYNVSDSTRSTQKQLLGEARGKLSAASVQLNDAIKQNSRDLSDYLAGSAEQIRGVYREARRVTSSIGASPLGAAMADFEAVQDAGPDAIEAAIRSKGGMVGARSMWGLPHINPEAQEAGLAEGAKQRSLVAAARAVEYTQFNASSLAGARMGIGMAGDRAAWIAGMTDNPLAAQLAQIHTSMMMGLSQAGPLTSSAGGSPLLMPGAVAAIGEANNASALARRGFSNQTEAINIGLAGEHRAYTQQLDRNPIGAEATNFETSAMIRAQGLARSGRPDQAQQSLGNALLGMQAMKQDYLNSFRAVQFDLRDQAVSPRDNDDSAKSLSAIAQAVKEIKDAMTSGAYKVEQ